MGTTTHASDDGTLTCTISTGEMPASAEVQALVDEAYARFCDDDRGENFAAYPALAEANRDLFGVAVAGVTGRVATAGDAAEPCTLMSVAKPFVFALVCEALGTQTVRDRVGVNATGLPFNSAMALEIHPEQLSNPMVNTGALAVASLVPGTDVEDKWRFMLDGLSRFAGHELAVDEAVYESAWSTNTRNRGLTRLLESYGRLYADALETVDLYTRQSSVSVTARDAAVMAATLANGGVNPLTGEQVVSAETVKPVLAVMATAGMYETSGDWLLNVGAPGKSGVSGALIAVAPGKGALGVYSPPLDRAGNSVRGSECAAFLSEALGLNLFASVPAGPSPASSAPAG